MEHVHASVLAIFQVSAVQAGNGPTPLAGRLVLIALRGEEQRMLSTSFRQVGQGSMRSFQSLVDLVHFAGGLA